MCNTELNQLSKYPADFLVMVSEFSDVDYYTGIKLFNTVLNRKGVCLDHQERYELFEKIYEEGIREKKWENSRGWKVINWQDVVARLQCPEF